MNRPFDTIAVTVLDGVGCGEAVDCKDTYPEDRGANSLAHASWVEPIHAPALQSMGLERVPGLVEMRTQNMLLWREIHGAFGALEPTFAGKGSPEGHQALMGYEIQNPYLYFDKEGFPPALIAAIEHELSTLLNHPVQVIRYPGTDDVSGTDFINDPRIGEVHLKNDTPLKLPVYASSDSVIQIAIHQEVLPQKTIEEIGLTVREKVCDALGFRVGRVIMRPFIGKPGNFERVSRDRRDYASDPDGPTIIDHLTNLGIPVYGIGKAADMLNQRGFHNGSVVKGKDDFERVELLRKTLTLSLSLERERGKFIFANLNATDELYGHRRKPKEYIEHINRIDQTIGTILRTMNDRTLFIVTSDHGNDPTHTVRMDNPVKDVKIPAESTSHGARPHTNHTRERVPLLVYSPCISKPIILGIRNSYADIAATIGENFGLEEKFGSGRSFLKEIV